MIDNIKPLLFSEENVTMKASSHIDTTRHDSMRHDPFFRSQQNLMDQFTHMQHDNVLSS